MSQNLPSRARVVIVGGGVIGTSTAYQLARQGVQDVVLLERKSLSSGTSWHAAGICSEMRASESMIMMAKETTNMFREVAEEVGHDIDWKRTGSVFVTAHPERHQQFRMALSLADSFDVEAYEISPREARDKWPLVNIDDVVGAIYVPNDALINPEEGTKALAKGAEKHGAQVHEYTKVTGLLTDGDRVTGVTTEEGEIRADYVVLAGGIWTRDFAAQYGVNVPLQPMEHYYLLTEHLEGIDPDLPLLRDFDARCYVRPTIGTRWHDHTGHLMLGFFERTAKPWARHGIPEDFEFGRLDEDWEHAAEVYEYVRHRVPAVREVGIETYMNGPESFTYDNNYFLGEAQNLQNLLIAAGFNSRGIQSCGGAGRYIAEYILSGTPPTRYDTHDIEAIRPPQHTANRRFLEERGTEILGLLYDINFPYLQIESARPVRTSPLHDRLAARGACFGEMSGWERANWYAPAGVEPKYEYTFGRQNWFPYSAEEHMAARENVAVFDQTSFGKFLVQGKEALDLLEWTCGNRIDVPVGKVVYTQLLNERGGIEGDVTVTRVGERQFLVYTTASSQAHDFWYLQKRIEERDFAATVTDITSGYAVLGVMGPRSRDLLQRVSNADFSNEAFPFATSRMIDFGYARARATRITFVGELGWEISLGSEYAPAAYDLLMQEGETLGVRMAGYHAINSLRLEKSFIHWGHDVSAAETPVEANVGFAARIKKPHDFLGKEHIAEQKRNGTSRKLVAFRLEDPEPLLYHYEPIYRNGEKVGHLTSGQFSPYFGTSIGLGYVHNHHGVADADYLLDAKYEISVMNEKFAAVPSLEPMYDPKMERIKA